MFDQSNQPVSSDMLRRLTDAAQTVNTIATHLAGMAASVAPTRSRRGGRGLDARADAEPAGELRARDQRLRDGLGTGPLWRHRYLRRRPAQHSADHLWPVADKTEYGNLRELVGPATLLAGGTFSEQLRPLVAARWGARRWSTTTPQKPAAARRQRRSGDGADAGRVIADRYFNPAMRWAGANGFKRALGAGDLRQLHQFGRHPGFPARPLPARARRRAAATSRCGSASTPRTPAQLAAHP